MKNDPDVLAIACISGAGLVLILLGVVGLADLRLAIGAVALALTVWGVMAVLSRRAQSRQPSVRTAPDSATESTRRSDDRPETPGAPAAS